MMIIGTIDIDRKAQIGIEYALRNHPGLGLADLENTIYAFPGESGGPITFGHSSKIADQELRDRDGNVLYRDETVLETAPIDAGVVRYNFAKLLEAGRICPRVEGGYELVR